MFLFCSLTNLLEIPQYYYTAVSDQKLEYNKIKYKKKYEQSYFYHKTDIFYTIAFIDVFIIILPISWQQPALLQYRLFFVQLNTTQSTGRAMNNKGTYEKDIRIFMEYVDVSRLIRAHGTSIQCHFNFDLHCVYQNI